MCATHQNEKTIINLISLMEINTEKERKDDNERESKKVE
jgi:hypothetical protein